MTQKHFKWLAAFIAEQMADQWDYEKREGAIFLIEAMIDKLDEDFENFDRTKFLKAIDGYNKFDGV